MSMAKEEAFNSIQDQLQNVTQALERAKEAFNSIQDQHGHEKVQFKTKSPTFNSIQDQLIITFKYSFMLNILSILSKINTSLYKHNYGTVEILSILSKINAGSEGAEIENKK